MPDHRENRGQRDNRTDTININQITKYIKFNKSAIKFNVFENENFIQPFTIPQRTEDPNAALLDTSGSKMGTSKNILRYSEGEIVELPVTLEKFIDLNCFFTFGVKSDNTFIYSIIYAHDPGFRLLDGGDIERFLTDFKMSLLDAVSTTTEKVTGKATVLKDVNADNYNTKEVILFMSSHLSRNILLLDLNENKLTMHKEFDHSVGSIVVIYSGKHYFPIANLMGEDIENNSCQLMIKHFS